jgi:hypothetical protein
MVDMLTPKGRKIKRAMDKTYGKKKAGEVFYASRNSGKITGVDPTTIRQKKTKIL